MKQKCLIYSFDIGSGSLGICIREGEKILYLASLLMDRDFAGIKEAAINRRQIRTRLSHKTREELWNKIAKSAGIEVLSIKQPTKDNPNQKPDKRMLIEFAKDGDKSIYSSQLLRIALLQGIKLEGWQIYKAIRSCIQHRGYDPNCRWEENSGKNNDRDENKKAITQYDENLLKAFGNKQEFFYPCYYEAYKMGIWSPKNPINLSKKLGENPSPARNSQNSENGFPNRNLVEKELLLLLSNAAKQFPKLKGKEMSIVYGPAQKPYASLNKKYARYRGTKWDMQGLLSQKVPRFDNRIISKCRLIGRLNVCKADNILNKEVSFLLGLKNMRYTKYSSDATIQTTSQILDCKQINDVFGKYKDYLKLENENLKSKRSDNVFGKTFWKQYVNSLGGAVNQGQQEIQKPKIEGRSSFCKPALYILKSLILSGKSPNALYKELVVANKNTDPKKGLIKDDYKFLLEMPNDWDMISIPDSRQDDKNLSKQQRFSKISEIISGISNRVVRHRLLMINRQLETLSSKYGEPDMIIFEIARDEFMSKDGKKYKEFLDIQDKNTKARNEAKEELEDSAIPLTHKNILKMRLLKQQKFIDLYDVSPNRKMDIGNLANYEIDHIVPQRRGGSDSFGNFVLTKSALNKDKGNLTPYEWLYSKGQNVWDLYMKNICELDASFSKSKIELLISDKAEELDKRKHDLSATAHIEKLAQKIACLYFGWGLGTQGDKRKVLFYTGGEVANIRRALDLNRALYPNLSKGEFKELKKNENFAQKNRDNKKHHALDALVLSILPEIKTKEGSVEELSAWFNQPYSFCKKALETVYPQKIKRVKPKLRETIYGLRCRIENGKRKYCFISHLDSSIENFRLKENANKKVENIFDLKTQKDFQKKLNEKDLSQEKWGKFLDEYGGNGKRIKKIALIDSRFFDEKEVFNEDGSIKDVIGGYGHKGAIDGQWVRGKEGHQGQIVHKDDKGKWKVAPVYVFESIFKKLREYKNKYGNIMFFKSGQLIEMKNSFEDIKKGIYALKTLRTDGRTEIEHIDEQKILRRNIDVFIEKCGLCAYKKQ